MKKFYFIVALTMASLGANAQEKVTISTYNGTNVEKFDGQVCNVTVNRYIFNGWNTIALPFAITAEELNEVFGSDCKLERLVSVENTGNDVQLNFQDCKSAGMEANTPYILYYNGENDNKKIAKEAVISHESSTITLRTQRGETVTMSGVESKTAGLGFYGILARDNAEAKFTKVDASLSGFLATRCYIQLASGTEAKLVTNHLAAGETTSINAITRNGEKVDVFTVNGVRVATNLSASEVNSLRPGLYVVKGQKVIVK